MDGELLICGHKVEHELSGLRSALKQFAAERKEAQANLSISLCRSRHYVLLTIIYFWIHRVHLVVIFLERLLMHFSSEKK